MGRPGKREKRKRDRRRRLKSWRRWSARSRRKRRNAVCPRSQKASPSRTGGVYKKRWQHQVVQEGKEEIGSGDGKLNSLVFRLSAFPKALGSFSLIART